MNEASLVEREGKYEHCGRAAHRRCRRESEEENARGGCDVELGKLKISTQSTTRLRAWCNLAIVWR